MQTLVHSHTHWRGIPMRLAADDAGIRAILLGDEMATLTALRDRFPKSSLTAAHLLTNIPISGRGPEARATWPVPPAPVLPTNEKACSGVSMSAEANEKAKYDPPRSAHRRCMLPAFDTALAHLEDPEAAPPPLAPIGTSFQQSVWHALRQIPRGQTTHYAALAAKLDRPRAARAVAAACAANPIAILIPCHRVIRLDGSISGYRWGVETKQKLLAMEGHLAESAAPRNR